MPYQKPEFFVLSIASNAVRGAVDRTDISSADGKQSIVKEGLSDTTFPPLGDGHFTSSTSGAYEADE